MRFISDFNFDDLPIAYDEPVPVQNEPVAPSPVEPVAYQPVQTAADPIAIYEPQPIVKSDPVDWQDLAPVPTDYGTTDGDAWTGTTPLDTPVDNTPQPIFTPYQYSAPISDILPVDLIQPISLPVPVVAPVPIVQTTNIPIVQPSPPVTAPPVTSKPPVSAPPTTVPPGVEVKAPAGEFDLMETLKNPYVLGGIAVVAALFLFSGGSEK